MTDSVSKAGAKIFTGSATSEMVAEAQRDLAAFASLYDLYIEPIYRYLYSRVQNAAEAEDLAAQTFLSALEALPRYQDKGNFSAWLFSIARSKSIDLFRQKKRERGIVKASERADHPDLLGQLIRAQDVQWLSAAIRALGEDQRELIYLRYVAGLTFSEIGAVLGKREGAVKKSLYRLLARLQSQMEAENE